MADTLNVYLTQTPTGTLAQKNNKIYFEYHKAFLKTNIELSPYKLPLKAGLFRCDDDTFERLWGLFADSLPDGWGRLLMDRHLIGRGVNPKRGGMNLLRWQKCHVNPKKPLLRF